MKTDKLEPRDSPLAAKLYEIIFESDTWGGKAFDLALLVAILVSVVAVSLETVEAFRDSRDRVRLLNVIEWTCTILFTVEYAVRVYCVKQPLAYVLSFFGIVDLLSVLPAYIGLLLGRGASFAVVRSLRLLRVFRILELSWVESEANSLRQAVWDARAKVVVFFVTVLIVVTIAGAAMYEIEHVPESVSMADANPDRAGAGFAQTGPTSGQGQASAVHFDSIPQSVYWAIITMTTVGYGDVVPQTTLGKFVAATLVLLGYSLIIVPTGFVSAELSQSLRKTSAITCRQCSKAGHAADADFCSSCGSRLTS